VLIYKGFKYRIYPTLAQIVLLRAWDGALRWLWNLANEQRLMGLERPKCERVYPTAFDQINGLTELRALLPWLAAVPRGVCAQLLVELDKAWQRCFKKLAKAPRWKRKWRDAIGLCQPSSKKWRIDGNRLHFPKLDPIRIIIHRPLEGNPKACTIKRDGDQWYACITCEIEIADPTPRTEPIVAIDRGVVLLVADSDGEKIENPAYLQRTLKRLAHAQRVVSRRQKGSKNQEKARLRVMRLHRKVRRQREHKLHQISHDYAKSHGTVVIEKLQIKNMTKSASGTVEEPGANVAQKSGLNRRILDAGWGKLVVMLRYKLAWSGGIVGEVNAAYSSQTCSVATCEHRDENNRRSQSEFVCTKCGHVDNADVNAAKVLKSRWRPSALLGEDPAQAVRRTKKSLRTPRSMLRSSAS